MSKLNSFDIARKEGEKDGYDKGFQAGLKYMMKIFKKFTHDEILEDYKNGKV